MKLINQEGINIIRSYEGLEDGDPSTVNLDPYLCPADVWTIGWGHAIVHNGLMLNKTNDPLGTKAKSLYPNGITIENAEQLLKDDVYKRCKSVSKILGNMNLNENQFSALVSFIYNVGENKFEKSTLLKKLKRNDYLGASYEFQKWVRSKGKILRGLVRRRESEKQLFLKK